MVEIEIKDRNVYVKGIRGIGRADIEDKLTKEYGLPFNFQIDEANCDFIKSEYGLEAWMCVVVDKVHGLEAEIDDEEDLRTLLGEDFEEKLGELVTEKILEGE